MRSNLPCVSPVIYTAFFIKNKFNSVFSARFRCKLTQLHHPKLYTRCKGQSKKLESSALAVIKNLPEQPTIFLPKIDHIIRVHNVVNSLIKNCIMLLKQNVPILMDW